MIEETTEMNDWLKVPSEVAVSLGVSVEQAKQWVLDTLPNSPLARRLREDWDFEETANASAYNATGEAGEAVGSETHRQRRHPA